MRSLRLPKSRVRRLSTYESLARKLKPENCNVVSDLGRSAAGPGRYSTDRPGDAVLVSAVSGGSPRFPANGVSPQPAQGAFRNFGLRGLTPFAGKRGLPPITLSAAYKGQRVDLPAVLE